MSAHDIDCEKALEQLLEYLDRELDAQASSAMSRHLEKCRGCFSRAEFELKLKQSLQAAATKPASERLRARIRKLIFEL
jgi:anti-sigma factor (TIGR02949 family)